MTANFIHKSGIVSGTKVSVCTYKTTKTMNTECISDEGFMMNSKSSDTDVRPITLLSIHHTGDTEVDTVDTRSSMKSQPKPHKFWSNPRKFLCHV